MRVIKPTLFGRFWLWAKRLAGVFLVAICLVYWAARTDRLSAVGYDLLYISIAAPAVLLGVEEKTVILGLLDQHCGGGHRWPIYGLESRTLFTCRSTLSDEYERLVRAHKVQQTTKKVH